MIYLIGLAGLICGFTGGQMVLAWRLRAYTKAEILSMMKDRGARLTYGLFNWGMAVGGAVIFMTVYREYFGL